MLKYSPKAEDTAVRFFANLNSINLFIEDKTTPNYYKIIIQRIFGSKIIIRKIFRRGGRSEVLTAARDKKFSQIKNAVFIVDADLYLLCGEKEVIPDNVLVLDSYCIENYFYCLNAAEKIAVLCETEETPHQIRKDLALLRWNQSLKARLRELFIWYAISRKLGAQIKTSISILSYVSGQQDIPDKTKVKAKISYIRQHLIQNYGKTKVYAEKKNIVSHIASFGEKHICAKNYLLPILIRRMRLKSKFRDDHGLVMRLAHEADVGNFEFIRKEISRRINIG